MATRQRKTATKGTETTDAIVGTEKSVTTAPTSVVRIIRVLLFAVVASFLASQFLTESWTWGYKSQYTNPAYWKHKISNVNKSERIFTFKELKEYNGKDPEKPIYMSLLGEVYDVTPARRMYGEGGMYNVFAGRDATRAFVTGCFSDPTHFTHDIRGFTEEETEALDGWQTFYRESDKYVKVGKLRLPKIPDDRPIPKMCKQGA